MEYDAPGISAVYLCIVVVDGTIIYAFSMSTDLDQSRENSLLLHAIQALLSEKKLHVVVFFAVSMTSQAGSNFLCVD